MFVFSAFSSASTTACLLGTVLATSTIGRRISKKSTCYYFLCSRYFILFLAWTWAGVVYCTYLNSVYVYIEVSNKTLLWLKVNVNKTLFSLAGRVCLPLLADEVYLPPAHSDDWDGHLMGSGINNVLKTSELCEET